MKLCLSHGGPNLYRMAGPPEEILVATLRGIAVLEREAGKGAWTVADHYLRDFHISALLLEPRRSLLFAGTHGNGLYRSTDGGATWDRKDSGLESSNLYSLNMVDPGSLRLYAGTEPAHLHVSRDLGETWEALPSLRQVPSVDRWSFPGPPHVAHVKNIAFDPTAPEGIYAAIEVGGLLRSTDAGQTWQELSGFYEDVHRVAIRPGRADSIYLATGNGIWHSGDGGATWEQLTDRHARVAYPDALLIHPDREELMFTAGAITSPGEWRNTHTADARVARSRDGGRTWEVLGNGLPEHIRGNIEAMSMAVWPGGYALFAGTTDGEVFASEDEGESWETIATGLAPVSKGGHYRNLREPAGSTSATG